MLSVSLLSVVKLFAWVNHTSNGNHKQLLSEVSEKEVASCINIFWAILVTNVIYGFVTKQCLDRETLFMLDSEGSFVRFRLLIAYIAASSQCCSSPTLPPKNAYRGPIMVISTKGFWDFDVMAYLEAEWPWESSEIFSVGDNVDILLSLSGSWLFNENGQSQNALPLLHHRENASW